MTSIPGPKLGERAPEGLCRTRMVVNNQNPRLRKVGGKGGFAHRLILLFHFRRLWNDCHMDTLVGKSWQKKIRLPEGRKADRGREKRRGSVEHQAVPGAPDVDQQSGPAYVRLDGLADVVDMPLDDLLRLA